MKIVIEDLMEKDKEKMERIKWEGKEKMGATAEEKLRKGWKENGRGFIVIRSLLSWYQIKVIFVVIKWK